MFKPVSNKVKFPELEKEILQYWKENNIFEKSVEKNTDKEFTFYDGPPFATGLPHYGHILAGVMKDVIPRYWTMKGYKVERRFGWDCHGLPVENVREKELNISGKKDIEKMGISAFNESCRSIVQRYVKEWREIVERSGRWVDMDNDYKTMDTSYMESIWWVFKQLWDKGLVYEGEKVVPYCCRCATPLSNFEATQGYQDKQDQTVTVKFKLLEEENTYILAWTTTPWTLPSNLALAVNPNVKYVKVKVPLDIPISSYKTVTSELKKNEETIKSFTQIEKYNTYIIAKDLVKKVFGDIVEESEEFYGKDIIGKTYEPLFPYFTNKKKEGAFQILAADFVTTEDGTGIVHIAPAYGEDDYNVCKENNISLVNPVDETGCFTSEVSDFEGRNVHEVNKDITHFLKEQGKVVKIDTINHSYPFCWRCDEPLIYRAIPTWFVNVTRLKEKMLKNNEQITWMPASIKHGRFGKWLENARDWAISRNRYWGSVLPIWQCEQCHHEECLGSLEDLRAKAPERMTRIILVKYEKDEEEYGNKLWQKLRDDKIEIEAVYSSSLEVPHFAKYFSHIDSIVDERLSDLDFDFLHAEKKDIEKMEQTLQSFLQTILEKEKSKTVVIASSGIILRFIEKICKGWTINKLTVSKDISYDSYKTLYIDNRTKKEFDLHKHIVDDITFPCTGKETGFYAMRHGESENNVKKIEWSKDDGYPLTEKGKKQVLSNVEKIKNLGIEHIIASPHLRTKQSAQLIAEALHIPLTFDNRLKEIDVGDYNGKTQDEIGEASFEQWRKKELTWPNGEHWTDVEKRLLSFYKDISSQYAGKKVLIVSHGDPLFLFRSVIVKGRSLESFDYYKEQELYPDKAEFFALNEKYDEKETDFYAMRHGEAENNVKKKFSSALNKYALTKKGEKQVLDNVETIKQLGIEYIIASPVLRAKQSAELISKKLHIPLIFDERLQETGVGDYNEREKTEKEVQSFYHQWEEDSSIRWPHGENWSDIEKRMSSFYHDLLRQYAGKKVLIISHGDPLRVLQASLEKGLIGEKFIKSFVPNRDCKLPESAKLISLSKMKSCHGKMRRIPEVLDCWFESGSMPYAQVHYPFENKEWFEKNFPADFIAEGQDQTRGWFYTLIILSTALFDKPAFKNVIVNGIVLAEDGKKMSKRLNNYPDPSYLLDTYGADAMRFYLMNSPAVQSQDLRFSEKGVDEVVKSLLLPFWNAYSFFVTYANIDKFQKDLEGFKPSRSGNKLDQWILSELQATIEKVTIALDNYDLAGGTYPLANFIEGLTNWYIRRSRRRFWKSENDSDKNEAYSTLYTVLITLSKLLAPYIPFLSEEVYRNLTGEESVHLTDWPKVEKKLYDKNLNEEVDIVRNIVTLGLSARAKSKIKVRQPLSLLEVIVPQSMNKVVEEYNEIIQEELNVKELKLLDESSSSQVAKKIVKPLGGKIGPKFGGETQIIIKNAKDGNFKEEQDKIIVFDGNGKEWLLTLDEVEVVYEGKQGFDVESNRGVVVSLNITLTEELKQEGVAREIIRTIQDMRKEADYQVSDRISVDIHIQIEPASKVDSILNTILEKFGDYIKSETLATEISQLSSYDLERELEIEGMKIVLRIRK